jgi:hypothetical protein
MKSRFYDIEKLARHLLIWGIRCTDPVFRA